jgi:hypothetical protein
MDNLLFTNYDIDLIMTWSKIKYRYHPEWVLISNKIKYERAKNRCEVCNLRNGVLIKRDKNGNAILASTQDHAHHRKLITVDGIHHYEALKKLSLIQIILTVAHLDHDENNNDEINLACLCQYHHLQHDKENNKLRRICKKPIPYKVPDEILSVEHTAPAT